MKRSEMRAWMRSHHCFFLFSGLLLLLVLLPMFENSGQGKLLFLLWCYFYALAEHFSPSSFSGLGPHKALHVADMIFLSFGSLTTAGSLDVVPHGRLAKTLVILEEVVGTLYIGAFVARLVAVYSSGRR